jgi:hypothetical protein
MTVRPRCLPTIFGRRELASLISSSKGAVGAFIAHCDVAARDLLMPHGDGVIALSTVLRIKRALDGTEIDVLFSDVQARKALAIGGRVANSGRASLRVQSASPGRSCVATTRTRAGQLSIKDALFA